MLFLATRAIAAQHLDAKSDFPHPRDMNAFDLGRVAYGRGKSRYDNPHPLETPNGAAWDHGWLISYWEATAR